MDEFKKRINYKGDLKILLSEVCKNYSIGSYKEHKLITQGYEDFNLILTSDKGKFFVKIFGAFRAKEECLRYISIIKAVLEAGITHPNLYEGSTGSLQEIELEGAKDRLSVFEYIDGASFFELNNKPTDEELEIIIRQATLINKIQLKPTFIYDSWSIVNFLNEYKEKQEVLDSEQKFLINPLVKDFESIDFYNLPHALVHGDLIKTNLMKGKNGKIYIIDFAVANYSPRIIELAVLFNDTFFDKDSTLKTQEYYNHGLSEYQKYIKLTKHELQALPLLVNVGHAMHLLRANYEQVVNHNSSKENEYFLNLGRIGLKNS